MDQNGCSPALGHLIKEGDGETQVDMESGSLGRPHVTVVRGGATGGRCRGVSTALLAVALCAAAAVLFMHGETRGQSKEENDLHHTLRQISQKAKGAIHLEGEYSSEFSNTSLKWRPDVGQSFSQGGLKLKDNEITVPRPGLYFVYSQASFKVNCQSEDEQESEKFVYISHEVERWSESYDSWSPLLSAVQSACKKAAGGKDKGQRLLSVVYLGAVFKLNAGDKLRTVNEQNIIADVEDEAGKTFFGVFEL